MKMSPSMTVLVAAMATGFSMQVAVAETGNKNATATGASAVMSSNAGNYSERERMDAWNGNKEKLEQALKNGASKDSYKKTLADQGYTITSINEDSNDYVEYEVVKGDHSYEVQIDMDKATSLGSNVDVDRNLWRTDATKEAIRSGKPVMASRVQTNGAVYSDRANTKAWTDQKDKLEKGLALGNNLAFYKGELKNMGYQITSTNDKDRDYVEYEVVKGSDSYEVQIDLNDAGKAEKVDVTSNMWQSDATERALARKN